MKVVEFSVVKANGEGRAAAWKGEGRLGAWEGETGLGVEGAGEMGDEGGVMEIGGVMGEKEV